MPPFPIPSYLNVRAAYFPGFTADGGRIVFLADITGVHQVWEVGLPAPGGEPLWPDQLTFGEERALGVWPCPAPGERRVIYARDVGGDENMQLILLDPVRGRERSLTTGHEGAMHLFGSWSADGWRFLFAANRRHPALFDLYLQSLDGPARMIWQNDRPGYLVNATFSPDEQRVAVTRMAGFFQHDLLEVDLTTGQARRLSPESVTARYAAIHYTPDGRALWVNTDLDSDFLYLSRLGLEQRTFEPLLSRPWDMEYMTAFPDGRILAYALNVDGVSYLEALDPETGEVKRAPGMENPPGVVAMRDWRLVFAPDSGRLAFSYTRATHTMDVYVWDLTAGRVQAVTRASHGGLPVEAFVSPELVHYPTFDRDQQGARRQIPAWYYPPGGAAQEKAPAVVFVHGGPESQFRPYFHFLIQYFVQRGYAVLAPNVRGSTGYGKAYSHLDDVEKRMDSVADLAHAAYWLRERPEIDGQRLVVYGGSYGGFMVLAALTNYPDLWAAGVDIVGISNFVTFLENTSDYRRAAREAEYGSLARDRAFLERISPLNQVDRIVAPLIVLHGANDPRVPLSEAQQLVGALESRGIPVRLLVFDDEGHGITRLKNKLVAYPAIVDFLDRVLGFRPEQGERPG